MSDDTDATTIREQNRRKLEEHLDKLRRHGGNPPQEDPQAARRAAAQREQESFRRDWEAWKRVYRGRIIDLDAPPEQDLSAQRKLLGVSASAGKDEIRKAFYALAKKNHPDAGGSEDEFRVLMDAYRSLTGEA